MQARRVHGCSPTRYGTRGLPWRPFACSCGSGVVAGTAMLVATTVAIGPGGVEAAASLISASRAGNDRLVRRLLKQRVDPDDTEGQLWGNTPLKEAANYGHLKVVELLIVAGADLDKADRAGETPLMVTNLAPLLLCSATIVLVSACNPPMPAKICACLSEDKLSHGTVRV